MKRSPSSKIFSDHDPKATCDFLRGLQHSYRHIAFTNGCFGTIHPGHTHLFEHAASLAPVLVVAVNSDVTYHAIKHREPAACWLDRAHAVASIECVDHVVPLNFLTPHRLLEALKPDFLVKADSSPIPPHGHEVVTAYGGQVIVIQAYKNLSTSSLLPLIVTCGREQAPRIRHTVPYIAISITDPPPWETPYVEFFDDQVVGVLRIQFADFNEKHFQLEHDGFSLHHWAMTTEHADLIAQFIRGHHGKYKSILIHCEVGVSRSCSCALAIAEHLGVSRYAIEPTSKNWDAQPLNPWVYQLTKDALMR